MACNKVWNSKKKKTPKTKQKQKTGTLSKSIQYCGAPSHKLLGF
jgi:hypothetical protein